MKIIITIFFCSVFGFGCSTKRDDKALIDILNKQEFEFLTKENLSIYDSIRGLALSNLDTIFKFRNERNIVVKLNLDSANTRIALEEDEYPFSFQAGDDSAKDCKGNPQLPSFLTPLFIDRFKMLGLERFGFTLRKDSTMEVGLKEYWDEVTNVDISHYLMWKGRLNISYNPFIKDSLIAPGWTYYISVDERQGK